MLYAEQAVVAVGGNLVAVVVLSALQTPPELLRELAEAATARAAAFFRE